MSKSVLYAANTTTQTIAVGGVINFGSAVRRYGCNCSVSGGNPVVTGAGYYDIDTSFTFTAGGTGAAIITLYNDGVIIPGATATCTTEASTVYTISIPAVIRQKCNCDSTITAILTGVTCTFSNTSVTLEKE